MSQPAPRLSFADTSAASLVAAVRNAVPEKSGVDWTSVEAAISTQAAALVAQNRAAHVATGSASS